MSYNPNFTGTTAVASTSIKDTGLNNTGVTLYKGTPVSLNAVGNLYTIDVSDETQSSSVLGVLESDTPHLSNGLFVSHGRLLNITSSTSVGSPLYVSKTGGVTDTKPSIGVSGFTSGDFVVILGIVAKSLTIPGNYDLIMNICVVGQL